MNHVHESTGFSPYRLMFGEECMLPMDIGLPCRKPDLAEDVTIPKCCLGQGLVIGGV